MLPSFEHARRELTSHGLDLPLKEVRRIATQALATGDVEAVLFDVATRLGIPPNEARATIASGLRAGCLLRRL